MTRIFAIPDIHGRFDLLTRLLSNLQNEWGASFSTDRFVFLGDMIDRGWQSREVVGLVRALCIEHPKNTWCLVGNHENFLLDAVEEDGSLKVGSPEHQIWIYPGNGGDKTIASYLGYSDQLKEHREWMAALPEYIELDGFFFSHAPAPRENRRKPENQGRPFTREELLWTYSTDEFGIARRFDGMVGVCGHIHALAKGLLAPRFYEHYIYADAGCGCSPKAPLVGIEVLSRVVTYAWPEGSYLANKQESNENPTQLKATP